MIFLLPWRFDWLFYLSTLVHVVNSWALNLRKHWAWDLKVGQRKLLRQQTNLTYLNRTGSSSHSKPQGCCEVQWFHTCVVMSFCFNIKAKSPPHSRAMPISQKARFSEPKLQKMPKQPRLILSLMLFLNFMLNLLLLVLCILTQRSVCGDFPIVL